MGTDVESLNVDDLGITMKRVEIFQVLVFDPTMGAIEVGWTNFFPSITFIQAQSAHHVHSAVDPSVSVTNHLQMYMQVCCWKVY